MTRSMALRVAIAVAIHFPAAMGQEQNGLVMDDFIDWTCTQSGALAIDSQFTSVQHCNSMLSQTATKATYARKIFESLSCSAFKPVNDPDPMYVITVLQALPDSDAGAPKSAQSSCNQVEEGFQKVLGIFGFTNTSSQPDAAAIIGFACNSPHNPVQPGEWLNAEHKQQSDNNERHWLNVHAYHNVNYWMEPEPPPNDNGSLPDRNSVCLTTLETFKRNIVEFTTTTTTTVTTTTATATTTATTTTTTTITTTTATTVAATTTTSADKVDARKTTATTTTTTAEPSLHENNDDSDNLLEKALHMSTNRTLPPRGVGASAHAIDTLQQTGSALQRVPSGTWSAVAVLSTLTMLVDVVEALAVLAEPSRTSGETGNSTKLEDDAEDVISTVETVMSELARCLTAGEAVGKQAPHFDVLLASIPNNTAFAVNGSYFKRILSGSSTIAEGGAGPTGFDGVSISLPPFASFNAPATSDGYVGLVAALYSSRGDGPSHFFEGQTDPDSSTDFQEDGFVVEDDSSHSRTNGAITSSAVLSLKLGTGNPTGTQYEGEAAVTFTLPLLPRDATSGTSVGDGKAGKSRDYTNSSNMCMFFMPANPANRVDEYAGYIGRSFAGTGCRQIRSAGPPNASVTCACGHLTSFAVLLDTSGSTLAAATEPVKKALSVVSRVGAIVSAIFLTLTIGAYSVYNSALTQSKRVLLGLSGALLVSMGMFVVGQKVAGQKGSSNEPECIAAGAILHFSLLSSFCWMLCEGVQLYLEFVVVLGYKNHFWKMAAFATAVPAIAVAATAATDLHHYSNRQGLCWMKEGTAFNAAFVAPAFAIMGINLILFGIIVKSILHMEASDSLKAKAKRGIMVSGTFFVLMGIGWFPVLLLHTGPEMSESEPEAETKFDSDIVAHYIFAILNSFSGFWLFVLHVWRDVKLRAAISHGRATSSSKSSSLGLGSRKASMDDNSRPAPRRSRFSSWFFAETVPAKESAVDAAAAAAGAGITIDIELVSTMGSVNEDPIPDSDASSSADGYLVVETDGEGEAKNNEQNLDAAAGSEMDSSTGGATDESMPTKIIKKKQGREKKKAKAKKKKTTALEEAGSANMEAGAIPQDTVHEDQPAAGINGEEVEEQKEIVADQPANIGGVENEAGKEIDAEESRLVATVDPPEPEAFDGFGGADEA